MTTDTVGGVFTYVLELASAIIRCGFEVVVASMGPPPRPHQRRELQAIPDLRVIEGDFKLEWMEDPWEDVGRAGEWLLAIEAASAPDVIHLNQFAHAALPWRAPRLVVAHSCVLTWWRAVRKSTAPASWTRYRDAVTRGLGAAELVVTPSASMREALRAEYGPLPVASVVIPNGRDPGRFTAPPPAAKHPVILAAGRLWDEAKNIAALARVAPRLRWPVHVAGETATPDGHVRRLPHVRALGELAPTDLAAQMRDAAIYALPARYEPFGLSVLEAALSGCALVLGDIPSLRESWQDAAAFVDPEDDLALEQALARTISDRPWRYELARRARARAAAFSRSRMATGYMAAYADLTTAAAQGSRRCAS